MTKHEAIGRVAVACQLLPEHVCRDLALTLEAHARDPEADRFSLGSVNWIEHETAEDAAMKAMQYVSR